MTAPECLSNVSFLERFGLFAIRERMADLGGALKIVFEPGKGFSASLVMPAGARA